MNTTKRTTAKVLLAGVESPRFSRSVWLWPQPLMPTCVTTARSRGEATPVTTICARAVHGCMSCRRSTPIVLTATDLISRSRQSV